MQLSEKTQDARSAKLASSVQVACEKWRADCARWRIFMRSKLGLFGTGAVLFLSLCITSSGKSVPANTNPRISSASARAQLQTKQPSQEFQGTIEKRGTKYILSDKASGANYQLSDQDKAKQYYGKDVKVSGTLDPSTNTIDVSAIKEMK